MKAWSVIVLSDDKSMVAFKEMTLVRVLGLLSVCGLCLSAYAVYVENMKHSNEEYQALCDLDETVACSIVLTSE